MSRMSARYIGKEIGMSPQGVYDILEEMGLVRKDNMGDWALTDLGRESSGRMSEGSYPVPTFNFDKIINRINEYRKRKNE